MAASAPEEASATHSLEGANGARAQAQDKEPRSSHDSSYAYPIVEGIASALQGVQVQQQQQAAANSKAGAFSISRSSIRPAVFMVV